MRPKIICHMVSSIDGRLLPDRWTPLAESSDPHIVSRLYETTAAGFNADGFLMGRVSMGDFSSATVGEPSKGGHGPRAAHIAPSRTPFLAVVFDPNGKLRYDLNTAGKDHIVAVLGQTVSDDYLAQLRKAGVSYVFGGADGRDLDTALAELAEHFGMKTILLGGGGLLNGAFLNAGLIDEVSVLVYPGIDGLAGIPSIFEYSGGHGDQPAAGIVLRLLSTEMLDAGFVWLRYAAERV
ncbi:dihydrofolate reductase family protein [Pannonibacter phragmitetus]|uniref:dihydrofolate reductase family protein n=1 Tax=Pannonibacter phragmitetus TaxID=121719 RepID=UPI000F044A53|nr:dihydrofolate reductase family protein [Pannonibacter phragmitetus]